jgi:GTP-binding protein Era
MIFLDTPGLLEPRYALHRAMRGTALAALNDADVVVHLCDATASVPTEIAEVARLDRPPAVPVLLVFNKIDLLTAAERVDLRARFPDAEQISAADGTGVDHLVARLAELLPTSPFLYPADEISAQSVRFFAAELVRETALEQLEDEVPYSVACEIEEFRESASPVYIRAILFVERDSQKRILIGAKGQRIRAIGQEARRKIEALIDAPVYLDLWAKVLPNWRRNVHALHRLGYKLPEDRSS